PHTPLKRTCLPVPPPGHDAVHRGPRPDGACDGYSIPGGFAGGGGLDPPLAPPVPEGGAVPEAGPAGALEGAAGAPDEAGFGTVGAFEPGDAPGSTAGLVPGEGSVAGVPALVRRASSWSRLRPPRPLFVDSSASVSEVRKNAAPSTMVARVMKS